MPTLKAVSKKPPNSLSRRCHPSQQFEWASEAGGNELALILELGRFEKVTHWSVSRMRL